ncbi:MAG: hypothetical protein A2498_11610 [Lentisphaerae bacterium RIFOXYC12_FULL_60_16]|nr:MAG: hypothetical protein A2498_11610 [Lentisphaerae bacterium RIFOXYC12_FULL_60_16]OGV85876.1 MAG: hypothetical protein A2340_11380 [Lentisphaerae bacterium RIFOXYB12_FULL_60_10]
MLTGSSRAAVPLQWSCPLWYSQPRGLEQSDAPVGFDMRLPDHLESFRRRYDIPGWMVYGVVRCLGSDEFLASGICRTYNVADRLGEDRVVVNRIHYEVPEARIRGELESIRTALDAAPDERSRQLVPGPYVKRRFGGFVLFSLNATISTGVAGNLLEGSGQTEDPMETFVRGVSAALPAPGWEASGGAYRYTAAGEFRMRDPLRSFRITEEAAIEELVKGVMVLFSGVDRAYTASDGGREGDDLAEHVAREEVHLRLRGVRVIRRALDLEHGICLVTVTVPKSGIVAGLPANGKPGSETSR